MKRNEIEREKSKRFLAESRDGAVDVYYENSFHS